MQGLQPWAKVTSLYSCFLISTVWTLNSTYKVAEGIHDFILGIGNSAYCIICTLQLPIIMIMR